jgi:hypothetical protein
MKQISSGYRFPEASICINKSRLKLYKESFPTYYLNNGQEFQIELFNPTQNTILAKIEINGNPISQGGLVLKPAERVFLERYLDIAKKFLFETYEVSNTTEVKKAIENNGSIKIQFFNESIPQQFTTVTTSNYPTYGYPNIFYHNDLNKPLATVGNFYSRSNITFDSNDQFLCSSTNNTTIAGASGYVNYNESLSLSENVNQTNANLRSDIPEPKFTKLSKTIETGRIESGSNSDQQLKYVDKKFNYFAFHTIEYKLLPLSQKINTTKDINVVQHCTNCGAKRNPTHKFCANCGEKL